jgi:hypothetical protein
MSYDISLLDASGKVVEFEEPVDIRGGTYCAGGTFTAWLNVTYNYAPHFYRVLGEKGIRSIYGLTGLQSLPLLDAAIEALADDVDDDYWTPTEGNAKESLKNLRWLASKAPSATWDGD